MFVIQICCKILFLTDPLIELRFFVLQEQVRMERSVLSDFELQEREVARLKRERERRAMEDEVLQEVRLRYLRRQEN